MLNKIYKWFDTKLRATPVSIVNFATLAPFLLSLISGFFWFIKIVGFSDNSTISTYAVFVFCSDIRFVLLMLFIAFFVHSIFSEVKREKVLCSQRDEAVRNYYEFLHTFRNRMGDFQVLLKDKPDNVEGIQLIMRGLVKSVLDNLCDTYSTYSGQIVSGCVKMLEPENDVATISNVRVQTFERSSHVNPSRYEIDERRQEQKIIDNTDFYEIVNGTYESTKSVFYQSDLIKYEKSQQEAGYKYKNTNPNWRNYYRSAIVAPIRIANSKNPNNGLENDYTILGFLCVDSMSTLAFPLENREFYTNIIKSYAALLYVVLEKYREYLEQVSSKKAKKLRNKK